jgi:hypothetical protein
MPHNPMLKRVRSEYLEMPGLRLTLEQARRLCGLERALCKMVLDALVDEWFLCVKPGEVYARVSDVEMSCPRAAKAVLRAEPCVAKAS